MRLENYLNDISSVNKSILHYIINLKVQKYSDIFDELDNSQLKARNINKNIQLYLKDSFANIPRENSVGISFHITGEEKDKQKEESIIFALKKCCLMRLNSKRSNLRSSNIDTVIYILISILLLITGFDLESKVPRSVLFNTILEGINIGGWIFLWEAISMLFFKSKDISNEMKEVQRIVRSNIGFTYEFTNKKRQ